MQSGAIKDFTRVIEAKDIKPQLKAYAHWGRSVAHQHLGNLRESQEDQELALSLDPSLGAPKEFAPSDKNVLKSVNLIEKMMNVGKEAYRSKNYQMALTQFETVLMISKNHLDAKKYMAMSLGKLNRHDEAVALFNSMVDESPEIDTELEKELRASFSSSRLSKNSKVKDQRERNHSIPPEPMTK